MRFIFFLCLFCFHESVSHAQTSYSKLQPELGQYKIGFTHYTTVDSTRTYSRWKDYSNAIHHRPIPVSIWYPAQDSDQKHQLNIEDYLNILAEEEEWEGLPNYFLLDWFQYLPRTPENEQHLKTNTNAFKDAKAIKERFPVLIYAPSYHASSIENFAMCEFLASQGYVVISSPSRGTETRTFQGATAKDIETQARDIAFLIQEAYRMKNTNTDIIATMGFSFGGLSNVLAQMQNEYIDATICLDGSIKYQYDTIKQSPYFDLNKVDVPFMHMAQKTIPQEILKTDKINPKLDTDFFFYDEITRSDAYKMQFNDLTHSNFSTLGILFENRDPRQDLSDVKIMTSYRWVSTYVLHFLNGHLRDDTQALAFLKNTPETNGATNGLISVTRKTAVPKTFTFNDFHDQAIDQNYKELMALYKKVLATQPTLEIPQGKLNYIGLQLSYHKDIEAAIRMFQFAITIYPNSGNLYDSLGETYMLKNDTQNAILSFKKSLQFDANNENAKMRLKQLE